MNNLANVPIRHGPCSVEWHPVGSFGGNVARGWPAQAAQSEPAREDQASAEAMGHSCRTSRDSTPTARYSPGNEEMITSFSLLSTLRKVLGLLMLALGVAGGANAQGYDFSTFMSGGGGGIDPAKQKIARGMGAHICLNVSERPTPSGSSVQFTIRSMIPEPKSRIGVIAFDTGRHTDLFSKLSVTLQSLGMKAGMGSPEVHPFLPRFTPEYWVGIPHTRIDLPGSTGFKPGNLVVVTATLGRGKTFANVISALNEGMNPATAASGLRVGVIVTYLLGGPPPGVGTINDDGGFVATRISSLCRG